jgi:hypothetical protein
VKTPVLFKSFETKSAGVLFAQAPASGVLFAPQAPASVKNEMFFSLLKALVFNF